MNKALRELKDKVIVIIDDALLDAREKALAAFDSWSENYIKECNFEGSIYGAALAYAKDANEPIRFITRQAAAEMGQALMERPGIVSIEKDYDFSRDAALRRFGLTVIAADPSAAGADKDYRREASGASTIEDIESGKCVPGAPECCCACAPPTIDCAPPVDIPVAPLDPASYF
jgi:hypothetical protein